MTSSSSNRNGNTINYLRRHPRSRLLCLLHASDALAYASQAPDGAADCATWEARGLDDAYMGFAPVPDNVAVQAWPVLQVMLVEAGRRGLEVSPAMVRERQGSVG